MLTVATSSGSRLMMSTLKSWCMAVNISIACARGTTSCTNGIFLRGELEHARLDALQVVVDEVLATGETEVVEEAVFDRRPDVVLGAGKQLDDRRRHQVGGAVAKDLESGLGRCWEWCACLSGVVDDLVWHATPILRSPPATALLIWVCASAGEAGHARGDVLARLTQHGQLRLGVEGLWPGNSNRS